MKILFTPSARKQFLSWLEYIRKDNPAAATKFLNKVETSLHRLIEFPDSGRRIPEFPGLPYREVIVSPYRFFYRVTENEIWIVAAWHGTQIPGKPKSAGG